MMKVEITGQKRVSQALTVTEKTIVESLRRSMMLLGFRLREQARASYRESGLHVRTGHLKGSISVGSVESDSETISVSVFAGQDLPYARAQEYGATIRPKRSSFLAIPIGEALTPAGVARFGPREITANGYSGSFVAHGVIFGTNGRGHAEPLFALKRSVTIPARPFMRPALLKFRPIAMDAMRSAMQQVIDKEFGSNA